MRSTYILVLICCLSLSCASSATTDPGVRRRAAAVQIIEPGQQIAREFTIIKEVEGTSCAKQIGSNPALDVAREMMRIEAGKLGADAVVNVACEEAGTSFRKNCWKSVTCRGDAVWWGSKQN